MKANWLSGACGAGLVIAGAALAQPPDIISFQGDGQLTWTNSNTNLFYRVEWAPSLTAPDVWHSNYVSLTDIRSSESFVTSSVPMFYRVCGSSNRLMYPAPVAKTGQTRSDATADDGQLCQGVAWPNPRFTDNANGTVTDNLTGLIWLQNANAFGTRNWTTALNDCATLNSAEAGLTDGSVEGDWRLPNVQELQSLVDYGHATPCLPAGHPFTGVQSAAFYWSGTAKASNTGWAWGVSMDDGRVYDLNKTTTYCVWPVRDRP